MSLSTEDRRFLDLAIEQARLGWKEGGIPIGAVLVHQGEVLAAGRNRRVQMGSAIRHGETDALERALHHLVAVLHVRRNIGAL